MNATNSTNKTKTPSGIAHFQFLVTQVGRAARPPEPRFAGVPMFPSAMPASQNCIDSDA